MKSCRSDGRLMQPDNPSVLIDAFFVRRLWRNLGNKAYIAMATTSLNSGIYSYLTAVQLTQELKLSLDELGYDSDSHLIAFEANTTDTIVSINKSNGLTLLAKPSEYDFQLYYLAPVLLNGFAFQGEVSKWAPFASARFSNIEYEVHSPGIIVTVEGSPGENVELGCVDSNMQQHLVSLTIPNSGNAVVRCPATQKRKK